MYWKLTCLRIQLHRYILPFLVNQGRMNLARQSAFGLFQGKQRQVSQIVLHLHLYIPYFLIQFPRKLFFFEFGNPKVTVHKCAETIQGRKLYEEIRYLLLYLLNLHIVISAAFNWTLAFLVTEFYLPVSKQVGIATTYWFFASVLLMVMAFTVFVIPEVSMFYIVDKNVKLRLDMEVSIETSMDQSSS